MIEIHDGWMLLFIYSDIILIFITLAYVRKIKGGRRMKNLFKKTLLAITAILLCGMLYVTGSSVSLAATDAESAQETGENAELTGAASGVRHVAARGMYHSGDFIYFKSSKGILAYNLKKHAARYVVKGEGIGSFLVNKGYLYYNVNKKADWGIYKIKTTGSSKQKRLCKDGNLGFIRNNRLYYGHSGLCSMKLDGTDKKSHMRVKDNANGMVFYYKGNYYYSVFPYLTESYSVDSKFKHKKKYKPGNDKVNAAFVRAFDDMQYNESLTVRGYQYGTLIKNGKSSNSIYKYADSYYGKSTGKRNKKIYQSSKKKLRVLAACPGYIMIAESNKDASYEDGTVKIINEKGKVLATLKKSQK